jgi:transcriptional regulator with XRE-family HTH domain
MRTYIRHPEAEHVNAVVARLGANLHTARKRRRLTQQDVAIKIGVSLPTYRGMEAGKATVSIGHLISAFTVLGLEEDFLQVANPEDDLVGLAAMKRTSKLSHNDF